MKTKTSSQALRHRAAAWLAAALACAVIAHAAERKPDFLFIYTDDHRWDAVGVVQREQGARARFPWFKSPNMDRLAAEGVRFRNAFVTLSLCAPSRAAFLTGRYNQVNGTPFPTNAVTHATLLRAAGYKTAFIGKWHMGNQRGQRPGFDYSASIIGHGRFMDCPFEINGVSAPTQGWLDDVSTDFAIKWMQENHDRPLDALNDNELGLAEDTVVVYSSDNGYYLGEHCSGDKRSLYEESLRIPFLVRYPRVFGKGKVVDEMVLNIDLAPTFLDLADVPAPKEMQGVSWIELAAGRKTAHWRQSFFAHYYKELGDLPTLYAVRTTTHKLVKYPNRPEWTEVFDLAADPYEIKNLASDAALTAKLEAELAMLMKVVNYTVPPNANRPPLDVKVDK